MAVVTPGPYRLTDVSQLPNVHVAFPGEHWSNIVASGDIVPGEAVVLSAFAGHPDLQQATRASAAQATSFAKRIGIAMRPVMIPDINVGSIYNEALGPNEIVNRKIVAGEYVHVYFSGAFKLTLCTPNATYAAGDLITWDDTAARPASKPGTGAWTKTGAVEANALFTVMGWEVVNTTTNEGILTVRSLRGQF